MLRSSFLAKALLLAAVVLFATAQPSFAQRRGGGGGSRGGVARGGVVRGGGFGRGGGYGRGGYYGGGYGGYGGYGGGWGWGGFGLGLGLGLAYPYGYGYGGGPYYGGGYYAPDSYDWGPDYYAQPMPYSQSASVMPYTGYQANYPPTMVTDNTAMIEVRVPPDAQIWFDGTQTSQTGPIRVFATPSLTPGKNFTYEIRATWNANGTPVTQTRQVQVEAGKRTRVDFLAPPAGPAKDNQ